MRYVDRYHSVISPHMPGRPFVFAQMIARMRNRPTNGEETSFSPFDMNAFYHCIFYVFFIFSLMILNSKLLQAQTDLPNSPDLLAACSQNLDLTSAQTQLISLPVADKDLVTLSVTITSGIFDVDIVDQTGVHYRQILSHNAGRKHLPILGRTGHQLKIYAHQGGQIQISCDQHIPYQTQKSPRDDFKSPRLQKLVKEFEKGKSLELFWQEITDQGTPLIEKISDKNYLVTFLARGEYKNIRLFGGPTHKHPNLSRLMLQQIPTDIWYLSLTVPEASEFSYQLAPDVPEFEGSFREQRVAILATAQTDPLNKFPWPTQAKDRFTQFSTLRLPPLTSQHYLDLSDAPKGQVSHFLFDSKNLGNKRDIWLYQAPSTAVKPDQQLPVLFLFDAENFMKRGNVTILLDNLIARKAIPPIHAVFISPIDTHIRAQELPDNPKFADFMATELRPFIMAKLKISTLAAQNTILAGASFGGLGATTIAFQHPEVFGNVLSMSGSYWWHRSTPTQPDTSILEIMTSLPKQDIRFFMSAGLFEISWDGRSDGILPLNRHFRDILRAKNYDVIYQEYASGHDIFAWRHILADGLQALLSPPPQK